MPDISMCLGGKCWQRTKCYRHNAQPSEWGQSYFTEPPYKQLDECDYFWEDVTKLTTDEWLARIYPGVQLRLSVGAEELLTRDEFEAALETLTEEGAWPR